MKKEYLKLGIIFFTVVGVVLFGLSYIFNQNAPKSKAAGETMAFTFNPPSVTPAVATDFTVSIIAKPSINTILRGYKAKVSFDKAILNLKSIQYKAGVVSAGLGDSDASLTTINTNGYINVVGEDTTSTGYTLTAPNGADLVTLTFTAVTAGPTAVSIGETEFYSVDSNAVLSNTWTYAATSLSVNGGVEPTPTLDPNNPTPTGSSCTPLPAICLQLYPTICPTVAPTGGWCPPGGGNAGGNTSINFKLKFQGIIAQPAINSLTARVKIGGCGLTAPTEYQSGTFISDASGVWSGTVGGFNLPACTSGFYTVYVKGQFHVQKKVCDMVPTETAGGTYRCSDGKITLNPGANDLDFSGVLQLVGDLPPQNGTVDAYDISLVRNCLGKTDETCLNNADVNRDGKVDTQDYSLIIASLSVKSDEE